MLGILYSLSIGYGVGSQSTVSVVYCVYHEYFRKKIAICLSNVCAGFASRVVFGISPSASIRNGYNRIDYFYYGADLHQSSGSVWFVDRTNCRVVCAVS